MAARDTLSREVLKWIQSLDLAYSVKNVRRCMCAVDLARRGAHPPLHERCRDFANGFLVAEMLSRYDDKNVQMHSYDNGTSVAVRKDNWEQLKKVLRKKGFEVSGSEVDDIIHCKPGAIVPFINKLYTFLTLRKCGSVHRCAPCCGD